MSEFVEIFEVGPRDGLQNEAKVIPVADKIALVDALSDAGFRRIECAAFVNPKWVPQMASSAEVMAGMSRRPGTQYVALVPNMRGMDAALSAGVDQVAVFGAASEAFSRANINASIEESFERFAPVIASAQAAGVPVRGYVSCVVECPYDGKIAPEAVAKVAGRLWQMGCVEIGLGETLGRASPEEIGAMVDAVLDVVPAKALAGHYHDTGGRALASIEVSLERGIRIFDAAVGGLGGCPFAPGAAGNVASEAVLDFVEALGFQTGLDREAVSRAAQLAKAMRG